MVDQVDFKVFLVKHSNLTHEVCVCADSAENAIRVFNEYYKNDYDMYSGQIESVTMDKSKSMIVLMEV